MHPKNNYVAKHMNTYNKPSVEVDKSKYTRKQKHKNREGG